MVNRTTRVSAVGLLAVAVFAVLTTVPATAAALRLSME